MLTPLINIFESCIWETTQRNKNVQMIAPILLLQPYIQKTEVQLNFSYN